MRYRELGKTGLMVSEIGLGAEWLERHNEAEGKAVVLRPSQSLGLSRLEKDAEKLKAAYRLGYADALEKIKVIQAFLEQ